MGVAYAGPSKLLLRRDIPLQSPAVATAKHGDRLEIIQRRRRFMKVRTPGGAEGWTEDHLLLSPEDIAALREVERRARTLPSQGIASTYELLNVHTEPNRFSPSFLQIKEGEKVDVVAHLAAPRTPPDRKPLLPPKPKQPKASHKKTESRYAPPPPPLPPPVPGNWLELSKTPPEVLQAIAQDKVEHAAPTEDWSLVRNSKGESGWVLTRRLYMAIPDDVAQYAEGHRITSYFPLGSDVQDGDLVKHNWLWTTISGTGHSYDFDSFRVFIWNMRRHRYETAYIQRNVQGHFPVTVRSVAMSTGSKGRVEPATTTYPGFSLCLADDNGTRVLHNYAFIVNVVRSAGQQPCGPPGAIVQGDGTPAQVASAPSGGKPAATSIYSRLKTGLGTLAKKWFNR